MLDIEFIRTHADDVKSWANLLEIGYPSLVLPGVHTSHALITGLGLVALVTLMTVMTTSAARAR